jgi:hypothetical protein
MALAGVIIISPSSHSSYNKSLCENHGEKGSEMQFTNPESCRLSLLMKITSCSRPQLLFHYSCVLIAVR